MPSAIAERLLADPVVPYLIVDPQEANVQAVAYYAVVGLVPMRAVHTAEGACVLRRRTRA
ncbi:MAG TPA: hypothetical protein DDX54_03040 [Rhodospirillaceae bacterium]|jgi:hypothetical protein|nr:hypothetical protein [Rhodospirillaceae bacterium]